MADSIEIALLGFISTCAGVDWNLNSTQIASITSAVFLGQFIGSLFWGPLADVYGRRITFSFTMFIITLASFASTYSNDLYMLIIIQMIVGFGIGGLTIPFDLLSEFLPGHKRGEYLMKMSYFWTFGSIIVNLIAWVFLSHRGWKIIILYSAYFVSILSIISIYYFPESPRWLISQNRIKEAEDVINDVIKFNKVKSFKFRLINSNNNKLETNIVDIKNDTLLISSSKKIIFDQLILHYRSYIYLFKKENFGYSLSLWLCWFSFGFAYYGVILFVYRINNITNSNHSSDLTCSFNYENIIFNSGSEFIGVFLTLFIIDSWGRPLTMFSTYLLSGISVLLMGFIFDKKFLFIISLIARSATISANSATWVITPELYNSETRATGHSSCNAFLRIGAFLSSYVVQSNMSIFIVGIILFIANLFGMFGCLFLPNIHLQELHNNNNDFLLEVFLFKGIPKKICKTLFPNFGQCCIKK